MDFRKGTWKDKILDYEIETKTGHSAPVRSRTWKDKILDYEIETYGRGDNTLNKIPWKDKILDYEIETFRLFQDSLSQYQLEKIRFSITRLKLWIVADCREFP